MIYLLLIYEFFKIGMFSFGGGYATIPFLYHLSLIYYWYTPNELTHMIAIASITPGPVGINVATYAGLKTAGIMGSIVATLSEMLPSFFLVIFLSKMLNKYKDSFFIKSWITTLKPIGCALLTAVIINLIKAEKNDYIGLLLVLFLIILSVKSKKETIFYMIIAGIIGILKAFFVW